MYTSKPRKTTSTAWGTDSTLGQTTAGKLTAVGTSKVTREDMTPEQSHETAGALQMCSSPVSPPVVQRCPLLSLPGPVPVCSLQLSDRVGLMQTSQCCIPVLQMCFLHPRPNLQFVQLLFQFLSLSLHFCRTRFVLVHVQATESILQSAVSQS